MGNVNTAFLTSMLLILTGYLFRRFGLLKERDGKVISTIVLNLTFPALILTTVVSVEIRPELLMFPAVAFVYCAVIVGAGYLLFRGQSREDRGVMLMCVNGFNAGLFAFPLIEGIWGARGLHYLAVFDIGNAVILLGLNYVIGAVFSPLNAGKKVRVDPGFILRSMVRSVPLMTYLAAIALNLLGVSFPAVIRGGLEALARANMAFALVLLGLYLEFRPVPGRASKIVPVLALRYGAGLAVGLTLFFLLPFDITFRGLLLIALILPVGTTVIPYSVEFGLDARFAAATLNATLVISFALMWILISVFGLG
jgi:predicted permease